VSTDDPDKSGTATAGEQATEEWSAESDASARQAELAEELAVTDERRAAEQKASVSGAAVASPGAGSDPKAAAAAAAARTAPGRADAVEGPEKPELYVAAAFVGAFLFARILKKIAD
jgi:hypothetical protein